MFEKFDKQKFAEYIDNAKRMLLFYGTDDGREHAAVNIAVYMLDQAKHYICDRKRV